MKAHPVVWDPCLGASAGQLELHQGARKVDANSILTFIFNLI